MNGKCPHCLTRIAPGRPVVTSVLGRPAASSSSPRQGVGKGPDRRSRCRRPVPRWSASRQRSGKHLGIQKKKGSRKETPAIRNHWFDKMHQSVEGGAWQRCSSINSNHHEKNGWDEHKPVIFANPPTFTQRTRAGRDGDVGRGTYTGDGSEVLTAPELAGHRRLSSPPLAHRRLGVPSRPSF